MQIEIVTTRDMKREVLDSSQILKIEFKVGSTVFSVREQDGELRVSIDGQMAIKPIGSSVISLSAGEIGE